MTDTEIMNEIMELEHQINKALALSGNRETMATIACRYQSAQ